MQDNTIVLWSFLILLLLAGRLRVYLRTHLTGDLLLIVGGTIFLLSLFADNSLGGIAGFIIMNVGLMM